MVSLGDIITPTFAFTDVGILALLLEILAIMLLLLKKPWMRYKFLHNKGIAFLVAVTSLFVVGKVSSIELPNNVLSNYFYTILNVFLSFVVFPIWISGIITVILFFITNFLREESVRDRGGS